MRTPAHSRNILTLFATATVTSTTTTRTSTTVIVINKRMHRTKAAIAKILHKLKMKLNVFKL